MAYLQPLRKDREQMQTLGQGQAIGTSAPETASAAPAPGAAVAPVNAPPAQSGAADRFGTIKAFLGANRTKGAQMAQQRQDQIGAQLGEAKASADKSSADWQAVQNQSAEQWRKQNEDAYRMYLEKTYPEGQQQPNEWAQRQMGSLYAPPVQPAAEAFQSTEYQAGTYAPNQEAIDQAAQAEQKIAALGSLAGLQGGGASLWDSLLMQQAAPSADKEAATRFGSLLNALRNQQAPETADASALDWKTPAIEGFYDDRERRRRPFGISQRTGEAVTMDPTTLLALSQLAGGAGSVLGGLFSDEPDYGAAYDGIKVPTVDELQAAGMLDGTAFDQVSEDPATRAAQMAALRQLAEIGAAGGMDAGSKAALAEAQNSSAQREASSRDAAINSMAMRGMSSGGGALAAHLMGQQNTAQANAMAGARAAGDARTRALQAMSAAGGMAGDVRGQDYRAQADRAAARDRIAAFNAQNARSAYDQNMDWQMRKAGGQSGAAQAQYGRDVGMGSAIGQGIGAAAGLGYDYYQNQKKRGGQP